MHLNLYHYPASTYEYFRPKLIFMNVTSVLSMVRKYNLKINIIGLIFIAFFFLNRAELIQSDYKLSGIRMHHSAMLSTAIGFVIVFNCHQPCTALSLFSDSLQPLEPLLLCSYFRGYNR